MASMVSDSGVATGPKSVTIDVTADPAPAPTWVTFAMNAKFPGKGGKQDGDALEFDFGDGPFDLTFSLKDNTKLKLGFLPDVTEAIWVAVGPKCPTRAGDAGGQFKATKSTKLQLSVTNTNGTKQDLCFALRFTGVQSDPSHPPYVFDPIVKNGGGGTTQNGEDEGGCDEAD